MSTSERGTRSGKAVSRPLRRIRTKQESQGSSEDGTDENASAPPVASETPLPAASGTEQTPLVNLTGYLGSSAPPITVHPWKRRRYIERSADLEALCVDLMNVGVLALDAEFSQSPARLPDKPSHRLSLLQLAMDNDYRASYVVDAQNIADLGPLQAPLENPAILKLFHGMGSDAKVLLARGLVASNTLDLEAVSRSLFGQRESGLQSMLVRSCGVWLDKSFQRADWSHRPLSPGMLAYAAQDAEMTLMLYYWLRDNYGWATALHHVPATEGVPPVAGWLLPYLEGSRPRHVALALAEAGVPTDTATLEPALRQALTEVRHPPQRARVIRLISDLDLRSLAPDLYRYLTSPASEERQSAARSLGRLYDKAAVPLLRPLLSDDVQEVRQAATLAVEQLVSGRRVMGYGSHTYHGFAANQGASTRVTWSSAPSEAEMPAVGGWQDALRTRYGLPDGPPLFRESRPPSNK